MAIFQGRYSWDGKKRDDRDPISWFPGAYDLNIIDLREEENEGVTYIRPIVCIFTNTGRGYSVSSNPEKFAKRICEDFHLAMEKVLWVEQMEAESELFEVITFERKGQIGENIFYSTDRRLPLANEKDLLRRICHLTEEREQRGNE